MHNSTHSGVRTPQFVCSGVWFYVAFDLCQNRKLGRSSARKNLVKNLRPDKTSVNLLTSFRESYTTFGMKAAYGLQSSFHKMNLSRIIHGKLYQIWDESCICTCFLSSYLFLFYTSIQIPRNAWWRKSCSIFVCWCKWWRGIFIFSQPTLEVYYDPHGKFE